MSCLLHTLFKWRAVVYLKNEWCSWWPIWFLAHVHRYRQKGRVPSNHFKRITRSHSKPKHFASTEISSRCIGSKQVQIHLILSYFVIKHAKYRIKVSKKTCDLCLDRQNHWYDHAILSTLAHRVIGTRVARCIASCLPTNSVSVASS